MSRALLYAGMLAGLVVAAVGWRAQGGLGALWPAVPEHAVASIERTERDFGRVRAGASPEAVFRITNRGGRRLILLEKSRSCGCLAGGRPEILVPPGKSVDLEIKLETARLSGAVRKAVRYYTNDPEHRVLTLTLVADVARADGEQATPSVTE